MYRTVADCYKGHSVFVTGGTGFLGKVLLEKLLYSCPGIDKLYLLVRASQDATAQQRIHKTLEHPLFSRTKGKNMQAFKKIIPIVGNISQPELGIKKADQELLTDKVAFVFHMAANVQFHRPLKEAMDNNVTGTEQVLNLCKRFKKIKSFVYMSTAYCQTDKKEIDEIVYPAPVSIDEVNKLLETNFNKEKFNEMLSGRPNTYTFSKAIAETLIANYHGNVPTIIIRPSIVSSGIAEPTIGLLDNLYGASGIAVTIMKGWNRFLLGKPDNYIDLIPVDYVSNLAIVAVAKCTGSEVNVFNICTSGVNPLTYKKFTDQIIADSRHHKFFDIPMPKIFFVDSRSLLKCLTVVFQVIPGHVADIFLLLRGKEKKYVDKQSKAVRLRDNLSYFTSNSWTLSVSRTRELYKSLSPSDRCQFPCDPAEINWKDYLPTYCQGIRHFYNTSNDKAIEKN